LKDKYDADNVFRMNQNIRPTTQAGPEVSRSTAARL
jgi:hypothetical protein